MAVWLSSAGLAAAQSPRAAANQAAASTKVISRKAARAKAPASRPPTRAIKRVEARAFATTMAPEGKLEISATDFLRQYQRVGRDLLLIANERRAQIGVETADAKAACIELWTTFRTIKIDDAVATPESRAAAAALLTELHDKMVRLRGVALTQECLDNPLAKDCT